MRSVAWFVGWARRQTVPDLPYCAHRLPPKQLALGRRPWQRAHLLQHARDVGDRPVFSDLAVAHAMDREGEPSLEPLAGGAHQPERAYDRRGAEGQHQRVECDEGPVARGVAVGTLRV